MVFTPDPFNAMWDVGLAYERPFRGACKDAAEDPILFECFRRLRPIIEIVDTPSAKVGYGELLEQAVVMKCSAFQQEGKIYRKQRLRLDRIDGIGNPPLPKNKLNLTPTILRYVLRVVELINYFGVLDGFHIAEIGGGYGGLAAIIHTFCQPASYTIYDLPEPCALATKYLKGQGIDVTCYGAVEPSVDPYDLCISDYTISELSPDTRQQYASNVLSNSIRGAIAWSMKAIKGVTGQLSRPDEIGCWLRDVLLHPNGSKTIREWLRWFPLSLIRIERGYDLPFFQEINKSLGTDWGSHHFYWRPTRNATV